MTERESVAVMEENNVRSYSAVRVAVLLGVMCSIAYFAVYIARNILSAVTPQMVGEGFTEEYIGSISSLYFVTYASASLSTEQSGTRSRPGG